MQGIKKLSSFAFAWCGCIVRGMGATICQVTYLGKQIRGRLVRKIAGRSEPDTKGQDVQIRMPNRDGLLSGDA